MTLYSRFDIRVGLLQPFCPHVINSEKKHVKSQVDSMPFNACEHCLLKALNKKCNRGGQYNLEREEQTEMEMR